MSAREDAEAFVASGYQFSWMKPNGGSVRIDEVVRALLAETPATNSAHVPVVTITEKAATRSYDTIDKLIDLLRPIVGIATTPTRSVSKDAE